MPTYNTPLRGVALSVAYAQAAAVAPIGRVMLWAYELWHPTLLAPIYFVTDRVDATLTLENTAPRNPGTAQVHLACLLDLQRPEESDTAQSPELTLTREGISGILSSALATARGSLVPWELIERLYASDDLTAPAKLPVATYNLSGATISGTAASVKASYADFGNVSVPRLTFRREEYAGLA